MARELYKTLYLDSEVFGIDAALFRFEATYDPGCSYGPPEHCSPPEGSVEVLDVEEPDGETLLWGEWLDLRNVDALEMARLEERLMEYAIEYLEEEAASFPLPELEDT